jgi:hypothetical protein
MAVTEMDSTRVSAGIPGPVTSCPGPTLKFAAARVTFGDPLVVDPTCVNTPTGFRFVPLMGPARRRVLVSLSMSFRSLDGWASKRLFPDPEESVNVSNCQRFSSEGTNAEAVALT